MLHMNVPYLPEFNVGQIIKNYGSPSTYLQVEWLNDYTIGPSPKSLFPKFDAFIFTGAIG